MSIRLALAVLVIAAPCEAWGRRGHDVVASTAARLLAEAGGNAVLLPYAYDLGYYGNVPDLLWKRPGRFVARETPQHFLNWGPAMEKAFGTPQDLPPTFAEYRKKLGGRFDPRWGVAPYRIRDIAARCRSEAEGFTRARHPELLVCLGVLSHYTADLAMPLHVTDDYDARAAGQPGLHLFFEITLLDVLDPSFDAEVLERARRDHASPALREMKTDAAVRWLIADSRSRIGAMLALDKEAGRKDVAAAAARFRPLLAERLAQAAIVTAIAWSEALGGLRSFGDAPLLDFDGCPGYFEPDPAFVDALESAPLR